VRYFTTGSCRAIFTSILFFGLFFGISSNAVAQDECTILVESTDGYTVEVRLELTEIIAPNSCDFGYTYNVAYSYEVIFTGPVPPANLWTLQARMDCDPNSGLFMPLMNAPGTYTGQTNSSPYNPNSDCATATPESLGCGSFEFEIQGPGISLQTVECTVSLPVEISYLDAVVRGEDIELQWQTSSEVNNSHFIVQRSVDESAWVDLEIVEGKGFSTEVESYSYLDHNPFAGNNFYRLVQVDFDGARQISAVVETYLESYTLSKVFPNPFNGTTKVTNLSGHVEIYSHLGQKVREFFLDDDPQTVELDLSDLKTGLYFLRDRRQVVKLVKG